jgi:hypothetical protein
MTVNSKKAQWEKENLRTVSCRLRTEEAERFRLYAEYLGTSVHGLLAEYVRKCLDGAGEITPAMRADTAALQQEIRLLRRKLKVAEAEVDQARARALHAEALVDKWLRSDDEKELGR